MQKRETAVTQVVQIKEAGAPDPGILNRFSAFRDMAETYSIAKWASRYLGEQVYGIQSPHTLDAKTRDLSGFVRWFVETKGNGDIERWDAKDTRGYLDGLQARNRSAATVNRVFASLRPFARWVHDQPGAIFRSGGLPTRGVDTPSGEAATPIPLSEDEIQVLFTAADKVVETDTRRNARPRRNRALLSMLFYTGLRVSELLALRLEQFVGDSLYDVVRKGNKRRHRVFLPTACRVALESYIAEERIKDDLNHGDTPLFLPSRGARPMTRQQVTKVLSAMAHEASLIHGTPIAINPSRLRHTLGHTIWQKTGSAMETASALGYSRLQYAMRYAETTTSDNKAVVELPEIERPTGT